MFAEITHIDQVRPFVEASDGQFYIAEKGDYLVVNYAAIMTVFPPMDTDAGQILRECRGLIFNAETGKIIRRPLHKFFNLGEKEESRGDNFKIIRRPLHKFFNLGEKEESRGDNFKIDDVVAVYDKLDGSMIAPFILRREGEKMVRWGTKMGLTHMTPDVEAFVDRNTNFEDFACMMLAVDVQPVFEYMAPKHRIVVNHPEEKMELLALRHIFTGQYYDYDTMVECANHHGIKCVKRWEIDPNVDLVEQVRELEGSEGVVLELRNGDRLKVKSLWYVDLHKNREAIAREKYVVGLILNERIDDAIGLVPDFVVPRLEAYTRAFLQHYEAKAQEVTHYILQALTKYDQKRDYAIATASEGNHLARSIAFKVFDHRVANPNERVLDIGALFKERILAFTEKSDTDFDKLCRKGVFNDALPDWNIWDNTDPISE